MAQGDWHNWSTFLTQIENSRDNTKGVTRVQLSAARPLEICFLDWSIATQWRLRYPTEMQSFINHNSSQSTWRFSSVLKQISAVDERLK